MSDFSEQLQLLRNQQGYSMQQLADLAKVSKSMISKIERNEVQPTLDVAARLAYALGKTLSEMLHSVQKSKVILTPAETQPIWLDPKTKLKRHVISPGFEGVSLEWLHVTLPPNASISCPMSPSIPEKYLLVIKGELQITINNKVYKIQKGDSFYFEADSDHELKNSSKKDVEYYILIRHK